MFGWLRRKPSASIAPLFGIPDGERIYAIGDIHGRADLLDDLLARIEGDDAARGRAKTTIILLGDLIDRGPDPAAVVDRVIGLIDSGRSVRAIMGNHEEVLVAALDGDADALRRSLRIGGVPTLASYGLTVQRLEEEPTEEGGLALAAEAVPARHQAFLRGMEPWIAIGDYLFVHAGIRPGVALEDQMGEDLRWIRKPFLGYRASFGPMVVHGHSIRTNPDTRSNRIGIDTGAYRTGRLTALALEGTQRWILQTEAPPEADVPAYADEAIDQDAV